MILALIRLRYGLICLKMYLFDFGRLACGELTVPFIVFRFYWPHQYYSAGNIWSHSFLELKMVEANIQFLVIVEVLRSKLFALYQYCR